MINESIFKAYDIRGVYPEEINETSVELIGKAYAKFTNAKTVAVGCDVRLSSPSLKNALIKGLTTMGVQVIDIGKVPTELLYFTVGYYHYDGGIQVSASHNPAQYNGLKMIRSGVEAISSDSGLEDIKKLTLEANDFSSTEQGDVHNKDITEDYLDFITSFVQFETIEPKKVVLNANFGLNGEVFHKILDRLSVDHLEIIKLNCEADGNFPKGRPDPMVPENRAEVSKLVKQANADMAICWDADGDRCFVCDENGEYIESGYFASILASNILKQGDKFITDVRNIYSQQSVAQDSDAQLLLNKAGHTFIKNRMRSEDAVFASENSGHFYFKDFYYSDSGIIPALMFLNIVAKTNSTASELAQPFRSKFFVSGEINFKVNSVNEALADVEQRFNDGEIDRTDGLSVSYEDWRFNVRASNTEPLLRLNIEAKDAALCQEKSSSLNEIIRYHCSD